MMNIAIYTVTQNVLMRLRIRMASGFGMEIAVEKQMTGEKIADRFMRTGLLWRMEEMNFHSTGLAVLHTTKWKSFL